MSRYTVCSATFSFSLGFRGVVIGLSSIVTVMNFDGVFVGDMERPRKKQGKKLIVCDQIKQSEKKIRTITILRER